MPRKHAPPQSGQSTDDRQRLANFAVNALIVVASIAAAWATRRQPGSPAVFAAAGMLVLYLLGERRRKRYAAGLKADSDRDVAALRRMQRKTLRRMAVVAGISVSLGLAAARSPMFQGPSVTVADVQSGVVANGTDALVDKLGETLAQLRERHDQPAKPDKRLAPKDKSR